MSNEKCENRIDAMMQSRLEDIRTLFENGQSEELGSLESYALSFYYVSPDTFDDQPEGYFRYQISWGGPSDEFRFFVNPDISVHRIEYWFMDWFDGAHHTCKGDHEHVLMRLWSALDPS